MALSAAAVSIGAGVVGKLTKTVGDALTGEKAQKVLEEIQNVVQEEAMQLINGETFKQRERKLTATIENLSGFDLKYHYDYFAHGRYWQHPKPLIKHAETAIFTICEKDRSIFTGVCMQQRWSFKPTAAVAIEEKEAVEALPAEQEAVAALPAEQEAVAAQALAIENAQLRANVAALKADKVETEDDLPSIYLDVHLKAPFFGAYGMECKLSPMPEEQPEQTDEEDQEKVFAGGKAVNDSPKFLDLKLDSEVSGSKVKHGIHVTWARDMETVKIVLGSAVGKAQVIKDANDAKTAAAAKVIADKIAAELSSPKNHVVEYKLAVE